MAILKPSPENTPKNAKDSTKSPENTPKNAKDSNLLKTKRIIKLKYKLYGCPVLHLACQGW